MRSLTVTSALANPSKEKSSEGLSPSTPPASADSSVSVAKPTLGEIWRQPLPFLEEVPLTAFLCRLANIMARSVVLEIRGLENIGPDKDPFVFVANHSQRLEAIFLPSILTFHRHGRIIRFMADWPMKLMPFVAMLYRRGQVITVTSKSARPRWLNIFRPLFEEPVPAFDRAIEILRHGTSVGIFPEATMNRHPTRLLRGQTGAARLALTTGVPVVPAGIRFPEHDTSRPISDRARMVIEIGSPIRHTEAISAEPTAREARDFHYQIMGVIAELSGKQWDPRAKRRRMHVTQRPTVRS